MKERKRITQEVRDLVRSQRLGVLATREEGQPYTSLVAFDADPGLKHIVFATTRTTRKYANIADESRVAFMIDNRLNRLSDFSSATAITITGCVRELQSTGRKKALTSYLLKHPHLESFATSPSCALMRLDVERLTVVTRFQHVIELHVT